MIKGTKAAVLLGMSSANVQKYCRNHKLGKKEGKTWYLSEEDIQAIRDIRDARWSKKSR